MACCRRVASEEYIANAKQKKEGQLYFAPHFRPRISIDERLGAGVPHALLMAVPCCRAETTESERKAWRAERASRKQRVPFKPLRRFIAVMVLGMYSLFPTLVASTASIFNCSDPIDGKRYLMADLTVTCLEGWHLVYTAGACVSVIVYCIGTPFVLGSILIFDMCLCTAPKCCKPKRDHLLESDGEVVDKCEAYHRVCPKCVCICARRSDRPWGFQAASFREKFGLLIAGYNTKRGSIVMAWEPLVVMLRKLFITLSGSLPRDPYIQISIALMILVCSMMLQALVQPYESTWMNVMDVVSLTVLIFTQVLSILYLYLDTMEAPLYYVHDKGAC